MAARRRWHMQKNGWLVEHTNKAEVIAIRQRRQDIFRHARIIDTLQCAHEKIKIGQIYPPGYNFGPLSLGWI